MSDKHPFAVLAVHPLNGMEILSVLAHTHKHALQTAACVCVQRKQGDMTIVAAFSLDEISNIKKILERAAFIGEGNGLAVDTVAEDPLEEEFNFFADEHNAHYAQLNSHSEKDHTSPSNRLAQEPPARPTPTSHASPSVSLADLDLSEGASAGAKKDMSFDDYYSNS